jgi:isoleucyl-tRNA synthetase
VDPAGNRAISLSPEFDYALVQVDGQALILAKDLVESVMKRAALPITPSWRR